MTMKKVTDRVREMRAKKEVEGASSGEAAASASADAMCSLAFQVFNATVGDRAYAPDSYHHTHTPFPRERADRCGWWLGGRCAGRE